MSQSKLLLALANQEDNKNLIVSAVNVCMSQNLDLELLHVIPLTPSVGAESESFTAVAPLLTRQYMITRYQNSGKPSKTS